MQAIIFYAVDGIKLQDYAEFLRSFSDVGTILRVETATSLFLSCFLANVKIIILSNFSGRQFFRPELKARGLKII